MSDEPDKNTGPVKVDEQKVISEQETPEVSTKTEAEQQKAAEEFQKTDKGNMRVRVHSPFRDYYDGLATSISAESATGPFDILPRHHNFISLLKPCEITIRTVSEGERKIRISGGIIHVKANQVIVFLDV